MPYFTSAGPKSGPFLWRDHREPIDVLGHRGDHEPIGTAAPVGCTEGRIMTWEIAIRGRKVPGLWIVLGREFLPRH